MFKAEIVADSKNVFGNRLTTFVITFPRIILAELNTHRMLSKNSASSRAIPFDKMVKAVEENPFIPIAWMKDHKGMQGVEYFNEPESNNLRQHWLSLRDKVVNEAKFLASCGLTKQIVNRPLETYMWHTVIITGTEWENFFALRVHPAAEIHMQKIASMMLEAYNISIPKLLKANEWHIPYEEQINQLYNTYQTTIDTRDGIPVAVKLSTTMAARTSYTVVGSDQKAMSPNRMSDLHDEMRDSRPLHASPFEHCGQCMSYQEYKDNEGVSGNFKGFFQYRKMLIGENAIDSRVLKK